MVETIDFKRDYGERQFNNSLTKYGVVVTGGSAEDRHHAVLNETDVDFITVDCREIESSEDFFETIIEKCETIAEAYLMSSMAHYSLHLSEKGILIQEFDSLEPEVQTEIARHTKGWSESQKCEVPIAFTCKESDAVVRAEPDLNMRIRSWSV